MPIAHHASAQPFLFAVGCPRSGTTLLQRLLDHHSKLAIANDTHFVHRAIEKVAPECVLGAQQGANVALRPELVDFVVNYRRTRRIGLTESEIRSAAQGCKDYATFVGALYRAFAAKHGKVLGGEKTPDMVRRLPLLAGLFPNARFVHIVRDGRDVALSTLRWATPEKGPGKLPMWDADPVATCALWWRWMVEAGRKAGIQLGTERYLEIRYEDLVAEPVPQLRHICSFLELPFEHAMLEFHRGRQKENRLGSAKSNWLPVTAGLRNWREQMDPTSVERFEALAGETLTTFGYQRGCDPSPGARRVAKEQWNSWATWRDERLSKQRWKGERTQNWVGPLDS